MSKRTPAAALVSAPHSANADQPEPDATGGQGDRPDGIPADVWALLQDAGALAAERLRDMLASPRFAKFPVTAQRALIELALTRAYGLPVRRSVSVNLSSTDADAIAASLVDLHNGLPERQSAAHRAARDITPTDPPDD